MSLINQRTGELTNLFKNILEKLNNLKGQHVLSAVIAHFEDDTLPNQTLRSWKLDVTLWKQFL